MDALVDQDSETATRWLIVEDESELISEFKAFGQLVPGMPEPLVARCVEHAVQLARTWKSGRTLAFIDMMVPSKANDLDKLNDLTARRLSVINESAGEYISSVASDDGSIRANTRQRLRDIDDVAKNLVDMNGGMDFLQQLSTMALAGEWSIFVFSARSKPSEWKNLATMLSSSSVRTLKWAQKPIYPQNVISILTDFAAPR